MISDAGPVHFIRGEIFRAIQLSIGSHGEDRRLSKGPEDTPGVSSDEIFGVIVGAHSRRGPILIGPLDLKRPETLGAFHGHSFGRDSLILNVVARTTFLANDLHRISRPGLFPGPRGHGYFA